MTTSKSPKATTTRKPKKNTAPKSGPTDNEIRKKAEEIYHDRIAKGLDGTPEDDWCQAEKLLKAGK